jgi:hypothetical protein
MAQIGVAAKAFVEVRPGLVNVESRSGLVPGGEGGLGLGDLEGELLLGSAEVVSGGSDEGRKDFDRGLDNRVALERMLGTACLPFLSLRRLLTSFVSHFDRKLSKSTSTGMIIAQLGVRPISRHLSLSIELFLISFRLILLRCAIAISQALAIINLGLFAHLASFRVLAAPTSTL